MIRVIMVETGTANLASMRAALQRAGAEVGVARDAAEVERAPAVVLPGVGTFGAAMRTLRTRGFDRAIAARIAADRPTLAVCVGLQVLAEASDEGGGEGGDPIGDARSNVAGRTVRSSGAEDAAPGLGIIPGRVRRFGSSAAVRVPQMGWNRIVPGRSGGRVSAGDAYFANSYALDPEPAERAGWTVARGEYGAPFAAAIERGSVLGCQFHPELSGAYGASILESWVRGVEQC
ncbi:MAG: imidazole glycerol phosphate synthase subunit HisH [Phycisphaerales bacterium]